MNNFFSYLRAVFTTLIIIGYLFLGLFIFVGISGHSNHHIQKENCHFVMGSYSFCQMNIFDLLNLVNQTSLTTFVSFVGFIKFIFIIFFFLLLPIFVSKIKIYFSAIKDPPSIKILLFIRESINPRAP